MRKHIRFFMLFWAFFSATSYAQVAVNVTGASQLALRIAVLPVANDGDTKMDFVIASDLYKTGLFQPINPDQIENKPSSPAEINFNELSSLKIQYILMGRLLNSTSAQFVLADVASKRVLFNQEISGDNLREIDHKAADAVIQALTGNRGSFATKIAYVLEKDTNSKRTYTLIISDIDGANRKKIYTSDQPILSPTWSPDGKNIAFMTYQKYQSKILVQPISGSQAKTVLSSYGTLAAPAWSPDGRQLAISKSDNKGNMNLYLLSLSNGALQQLTNASDINTEAAFSPDNRYIYFTSDRSGTPQIYRMNRDGGNTSRAVIGGNYSTSGEVSPDGNSLALTRQTGGSYQVGLYNLETGQFHSLTNGKLDGGATFAPNGLLLMYTAKENGLSVIKTVNLKGTVVQTISEPNGRLKSPSWGPGTTD